MAEKLIFSGGGGATSSSSYGWKMSLFPKGITANTAKCPDCWSVASGDGYFEIDMPADGLSAGWKLIRGTLLGRGGDFDARLYYNLGNGLCEERFFSIPTSGKGVINEVVRFPAGITRLRFVPMRSAGEFELFGLSFADIGVTERIWRMARRAMTMIWLHSVQKRNLLGLSIFRILVDLQGAYDAANKLRAHTAAPIYQDWLTQFDTLDVNDVRLIERDISNFKSAPNFNVLVVADGVMHGGVQMTLRSLDAQVYQRFTCTVLGLDMTVLPEKDDSAAASDVCIIGPEQTSAWLEMFGARLASDKGQEWIILLRAGEVLVPHALYRFSSEVINRPDLAIVYADDDELDERSQQCRPRFKPDWSLTHLLGTNFVGNAAVLRGNAVVSAGGLDRDCFRYSNYDLLLRVVDALGDGCEKRIVHIPAVLLHDARAARSDKGSWEWSMNALRTHLSRNGVVGEVSGTLPECWRIRYRLPEVVPVVSIMIPTRDGLHLLERCVDSILQKSSYSNYEIIIVDNQSVEPKTLAYFHQVSGDNRVRVLHYDESFNYSAINNFAARQARGEVLCLLNNDTEVISPDWLEEMVGHLLQDKVGIVGAKLYYPDGRVQHGGDLVGVGGIANHAHVYLHRTDPGYCNRAVVAQDLSAVTAACMVTWRNLYLELGGLDEEHLKVAFNDVDYCLRVREAGRRVVWTPHAELYHHESVSRGKDDTPEKRKRAEKEAKYMRTRWRKVLARDPFYNPNLSHERADFSLSHAPMVKKPWVNGST